jgi:hypothetical protein
VKQKIAQKERPRTGKIKPLTVPSKIEWRIVIIGVPPGLQSRNWIENYLKMKFRQPEYPRLEFP